LGVHQDDLFDGLARQVIGPHEGQLVPVEGQEAAQVAVEPPGQDRYGLRI